LIEAQKEIWVKDLTG